MRLSVIIPALNEAASIESAILSAFMAGAHEVIVGDGGSSDETCLIAGKAGARVMTGHTMRARQMNAAAGSATGDVLLFLHADTRLPVSAAADIRAARERGSRFGGFRVSFVEPVLRLRIAAFMINLRTSITRCPWGDQAQFIERELFMSEGGFREIPLMEDYEMAVRMKKPARSILLPARVVTSGRRFLAKGVLRTAAMNWRIIAAFRRGVSPDELARMYRS